MPKIPAVLVVLNKNNIQYAVNSLNFDNAQLVGIITELGGVHQNRQFLYYENIRVPIFSFSEIGQILTQGKNFAWLISGFVNGYSDIYKTKKFLMSNGVPENNIVNFEIISHITQAWVANIRYIEKNPVKFFATGISYIEAGLNFRALGKGGGYGDKPFKLQSRFTARLFNGEICF